MNLFLHGIGPDNDSRRPPIAGGEDSLRNEPYTPVDVVLTNPIRQEVEHHGRQ